MLAAASPSLTVVKPPAAVEVLSDGAPGRIRTCDLPLRRRLLCPLSYGDQRESSVMRAAGGC